MEVDFSKVTMGDLVALLDNPGASGVFKFVDKVLIGGLLDKKITDLSVGSAVQFVMHELEDLIKALQIFLKYANLEYPTHCLHDELSIVGIDPADVSSVDKDKLRELGFLADSDSYFYSFRFGNG